MIDQLIYQYLLRMCVPPFRAREGYRLTVNAVHVLGTCLSLSLSRSLGGILARRYRGFMDLSSGSAKGEFDYLTISTLCTFFAP